MTRRCFHVLVLGVMIAAGHASFAEAPPPVGSIEAPSDHVAMKRKPSMGVHMGAFHVSLEKTTLAKIRRAAAVGEVAHRGDAGDSTYWLCYTNVTSTRSERIWFIASEMGGSEHLVTGVSAKRVRGGRATSDCPALPRHMMPLSLDNGLWLGTSARDTDTRLGVPSPRTGAWRSYGFQGKVPGKCEGGGFDLFAWLLLHFNNGRIDSLQIGQVTSC